MTSDNDEARAFRSEWSQTLAASADDHGIVNCRGGELRWYRFGELILEIEVDTRESAAFGLMSRAEDGRPPDGYYLGKDGKRVRWHLSEVLAAAGQAGPAAELKEMTRLSGDDAKNAQISLVASLVLAHKMILEEEIVRRSNGTESNSGRLC